MTAQAANDKTVIELPGARNGFLSALAGVSVALVATIVLLIKFQQLPIYMVAMLGIVAAGCVAIIVVVLDQMMGSKVTVSDDAVTVGRLLGGATYPWPKIEDIKVVAPTNSLGDNPFTDHAKRLGLGLFMTGNGRIRENDLDADVILCAMPEGKAEVLVNIAERLKKMRPKSGFRPAAAAAPPRIGAKKGDFRQRGAKIAAR